ncbi:MAG: hypothetical protein ACLUFK_07345 [Oscillospiraceae bacterium]
MRFADYFFDGLFVDWMVLDRIQQSTDQVEETYARIKGVLDWLNKSLEQATARTNELRTGLTPWSSIQSPAPELTTRRSRIAAKRV